MSAKPTLVALKRGCSSLFPLLEVQKDLAIIDFEGEPARPIGERPFKRSPLRDVAGMLRSFHYAAFMALRSARERGVEGSKENAQLEPWASFWYISGKRDFPQGLPGEGGPGIVFASDLPPTREETTLLVNVFLLGKAIYELRYELDDRPDWVHIPLLGILQLLKGSE